MPLLVCLQFVTHEKAHPYVKEAIGEVIQSIREGRQFSDAIEKHRHLFRRIFVRLARVGEETGDLSKVLRRGTDYIEAQVELKG